MTNEKELVKHLKEVKNVLDSCSIPFWLEDGTLLGAVRDGRMIPWDRDIDLGAFATSFQNENVRKKVARQLANKGFNVYFFRDSITVYRDNFHTDIILLKPTSDKSGFIVQRFLSQNAIGKLLVKLHKLQLASYYGWSKFNRTNSMRDNVKANFFSIAQTLPLRFRAYLYNVACYLFAGFEKTIFFSLVVPAIHFKYLKSIKYCGLRIKIPNAAEAYLEKKYGDWKKPPRDPKRWKWYDAGEWPNVATILNRRKMPYI